MARRDAGGAPPPRPTPALSGAARRGWASVPGVAEALIWASVLTVPLILVPSARDAFTLPKLMLAGALALASALVLAFGAATGRGAGPGRPGLWRHPALRPALLVVLPVFAAAALSWAATGHREHAADAMADLAVGAVALLLWTAGLPSERLRRPLAGLLVPAALLAAVGVAQFHGVHFLAFTGGEEATRVGVTSLAGNSGHLGAFLALALVVGQALLPRLAGWRRGAAVVALALGLYGLVASLTLTSVAALALGSAVVWLTLLERRRAVPVLAAVAVVAVALLLAVAPLRERVLTVIDRAGDWQLNVLMSGRLDGWRAGLEMFAEEPLTGVGPGAYAAEFNAVKLTLLDRGVPFYQQHVQPTFANAHQELVEVAAEWGVPGLAALLWALWVVFAAVRRLGRGVGEAERGAATRAGARALRLARSDAALGRGGLAVLAVLALAHFPFRIALTAYPALLWLAWLLRRASELGMEEGAEETVGAAAERAGGARRLLAWVVMLALVAALGLHAVRARNLLRASEVLNGVEQATVILASRGRLPAAFLWSNLRRLREAEALDPASVGVVVAAAGQHLLLDRPEEAAAEYHRALELEPRPEIWFNLGRAQAESGRRDEALASWITAARLDPQLLRQVPAEARVAVRDGVRAAEAEAAGAPP